MMTVAYATGGNLYLNLTNRCSNVCTFCVRSADKFEDEFDLWLDREPTLEEVLAELQNIDGYNEVVFCGYGEPLYRLDIIPEICDYVHSKGKKTRLNTNGQALLFAGADAAAKLYGKIDIVSISLNASSAEKYDALCFSEYGTGAYDAVKEFAKECKKYIPRVILSVVDMSDSAEIGNSRAVAEELGCEFRVRGYIEPSVAVKLSRVRLQ